MAKIKFCIDQTPLVGLVVADEGDGSTALASPTCAADAMHVRHWVIRCLVVDHVGDVIDINAARCHIGGHQDVYSAGTKRLQGLLASNLTKVTVDRGYGKSPLCEILRDVCSEALRACEDDGASPPARLEDSRNYFRLVHTV